MPLDSRIGSIAPSVFYKSSHSLRSCQNVVHPKPGVDFDLPWQLRSILDGPCRAWKVFQRQNDALKFSKTKKSGLMTFAFQDSNGNRLFLSAHPVFFWFYDNHKEPEHRRTYEVITEGAVCKLYFDLEFETEFNPLRDGVRMTNTFITIVCYFLKEEFGLLCNRKHVLDLDSTSSTKFSRHLIFNIPGAMFRDNYNVGNFVKMICERLRLFVLSAHTLQELCSKSCVSEENVRELFVHDRKGVQKLFCDEGVYTKNRHFRLYKSTKFKKNAPLLLSKENEFQSADSKDSTIPEKQHFLDSLVTYIPDIQEVSYKILEYGQQEKKQYIVKNISNLPDCPVVSEAEKNSPMPIIDRYIQRIVSPGRIRCSTYLSNAKKILYEISGNRFCNNIGRAHKSNNIYFVADLENCCVYQKCHDPDCSGFRSQDIKLPPEIVFFLENEGDACLQNVDLSDSELLQVWEVVQALCKETPEENETMSHSNLNRLFIPDFGLSDSDLLTAATIESTQSVPDCGLSDSDMLCAGGSVY